MDQVATSGTETNNTNGTKAAAPPPPPASVKPSLPPITDDDEDDDIPLGQLAGRSAPPKSVSTTPTTQKAPASTTPKPAAAKPASVTVKPAASPTAKPAATVSKPAATTPKPAATTPKPPATTPSTAKPAATTPPTTKKPAATTAKPAAATPKPAASTAKPASTTKAAIPTPSSKDAAATNKGDKIEKTIDTKTETTTTPKAIKSTTTTTTTTRTDTPTAASKVTVTDTLTTTTPTKAEDDSDDDKPLSSLAHEKKTVVVKKEKKDNEIVTKEKTVTVKKEVKKEDSTAKKAVVKKETPVKKPQKRKAESSDSESDFESSEDEKPKKKLRKKMESDSDESEDDTKKSKAKAKARPKNEVKEEETKKRGKKKEGEEEAWKWWEEDALPDGKKWTSLIHNGVMFAEPYVPHGVKFYYDGKPINLSPAAEEVVTFYAKYLETDYPKKENFNTNFWGEFRSYLTADQKKIVKDFAKADFSHIHKYLVDQKELKSNKTLEQKKAEKEEKEKLLQKYGFAMINGHRQRIYKISNWAIERPGLFLGRGAHPKTGLVKKRIEAEDITINIAKGVPVPEPPPGHKWLKVVHDDKVAWLAMWKENINNGFKYVWLHASSAVKGRSDMKKFEVARKLKGSIEKIRKKYYKELDSDELEVRQRSTALYLIDRLALRVGNEKDEETADTVGCCSLRVEHIVLAEPASVTLDFLGKDSMRYFNTVDVDPRVYKNLSEFMFKGGNKKTPKKPENDLFDQLTTSSLNKYLKEFMPNLSAKVFRTYNASLTLEKELSQMPASIMKATNDEKVLFYNRCNREVAILCNHQRSLSKSHTESMGKIDEKITDFEHKKEKLQQQIAYLRGKGKKPVLSDSEDDEDTPKKATPKKATPKKETPSKDEATAKKRKKGDDDDEVDDFKETPKKKVKRALPDDIDKCKAAIERVDASINKWNIKRTEKDELKSVALTTSKINYIDPRITAAWAKKVGLPMEKLFSKSLREKFPWAMDVDTDWKF